MWVSVDSKSKSYWMLWEIALLFIFLYPTSGLLLLAVTALFVAILLGLQEVERRGHFSWNLSGNHLAELGGVWHSILWGWCTKQDKETFLFSDTLRLSCLLSGIPNRSGGLFYLLTLLRFNSKRSTKQVRKDYSTFRHFYSLARYAKHQTGQGGLFYPLTLYG